MSRKRTSLGRRQQDKDVSPDSDFFEASFLDQSFSENDAHSGDSSIASSSGRRPHSTDGQVQRRAPLQELSSQEYEEDTLALEFEPRIKRVSMISTSMARKWTPVRGAKKSFEPLSPLKTPLTTSAFRRFSRALDRSIDECHRSTPRQLESDDLGSPQKVWGLLCSKDEIGNRWWGSQRRAVTFSHRRIVLDWLMEVCYDCKVHRETYHLAMDYFDRFVALSPKLSATKLQLVATTALSVAAKMEEIYPPKLATLVDFSDNACTIDEVLRFEHLLLAVLDWNCTPITSVHWLAIFMRLIAKANIDEPCIRRVESSKSDFPSPQKESAESLDDSLVLSLDGTVIHNSRNDDSCLDLNNTYSEGHLVVNQSARVPRVMRDEFIYLAGVLDLVCAYEQSLKYKYSHLAAAAVFCAYEPHHKIEEVIGFQQSDLTEVIAMVRHFMSFCRRRDASIDALKLIPSEIPRDEQHNIQLYFSNIADSLNDIDDAIEQSRIQRHAVSKLSVIERFSAMTEVSNES